MSDQHKSPMALWVTVAVTGISMMAISGCGDQDPTSGEGQSAVSAPASTQTRSAAVDPVLNAPADVPAENISCPVSGEGIDPDGRKLIFRATVYGFCCDDCLESFRTDPKKYAWSQ